MLSGPRRYICRRTNMFFYLEKTLTIEMCVGLRSPLWKTEIPSYYPENATHVVQLQYICFLRNLVSTDVLNYFFSLQQILEVVNIPLFLMNGIFVVFFFYRCIRSCAKSIVPQRTLVQNSSQKVRADQFPQPWRTRERQPFFTIVRQYV